MESEVRKYESYKADLKFMLICSGLWPNYEKHPLAIRILLSLISCFAIGFTWYGILTYCLSHATNIKLLVKGISPVLSFSSTFLKVTVTLYHKKNLQILNEGVTLVYEQDLKVPEWRRHLLARFRKFFWLFYVYDYSTAAFFLFFGLFPISLARQGKYVRMYPQNVPFDYSAGGWLHWLFYSFELFCGFLQWSVSCGVDSLFGLYALQMVGELRLLSHRFQNLRSSVDYRKELKDCIDRHILLTRSRRLLEEAFGFLSVWLAVTCAIVLCALVYQVAETKHLTVLKICYLICYTFLKLTQAYGYAWFGHVIAEESDKCLASAYEAHWTETGDPNFMNDVLIVLSQKPLTYKAMGVMLVEMDMFAKIVKATVSYFFLLQTLEQTFDATSN